MYVFGDHGCERRRSGKSLFRNRPSEEAVSEVEKRGHEPGGRRRWICGRWEISRLGGLRNRYRKGCVCVCVCVRGE